MKIINVIVGVIAGLMLLLIFVLVIMSPIILLQPQFKRSFTQNQINSICETFKFELAEGETIYTRYHPGFLQGRPTLNVIIENIHSEEDFSSRFDGEIIKETWEFTHITGFISSYEVEIFYFEPHWESASYLIFYKEDDKLNARFYIDGYNKRLESIHNIVYNPYLQFIKPIFVIPPVIETACIIFLIIQYKKYKRRKQHGHNQDGTGARQGNPSR
ncbi:MAG: hypothetical protein FWD34_01340 [Oscillospiraceae bacterium]|nr:hypothetical protein [Oscillospiraceae bacterium]